MSKTAPKTAVLEEIAAVAGEAAAVALVAQVGGTRVYIPARFKDEHWLVECIGRPAALKLAAHFSASGTGDYIVVPLAGGGAYPQLRRAIAKRVHELDKDGKSAPQIAREVGVTQRTVHNHRRAHRGQAKRDQGSLF